MVSQAGGGGNTSYVIKIIIIINSGGYSLIGVTSWGDGCAVDGTFGVYARVEFYMQWVARQFRYAGVG